MIVPDLAAVLLGDGGPAGAPAVSDAGGVATWGELRSSWAQLAGGLRRAGLAEGSLLEIEAAPRRELLAALGAAWRLGAAAALRAPGPARAQAGLGLSIDGLEVPWGEAEASPPLERAAPARPEALALVLQTSGSTGEPKGVEIARGALDASARVAAELLGLGPEDRGLVMVSPSARFGVMAALAHLAARGRVALDPLLAGPGGPPLERLRRAAPTVLTCVPTQLRILLDRGLLSRATAPDLRLVRVGAGPVTAHDRARLRQAAPGAELVLTYGLTETGELSAARGTDLETPGCVGTPLGDVELAILPAAGPGAVGEIAVAGPRLFTGYRGAAPRVGPLETGDLGRRDAGGRLHLEGRLKEIAKVGGETVGLLLVEAVLGEIRGVAEAAVVAAPDALLGEVPVAFAAPAPGAALDAEAIRCACAARLPRAAVPRRVVLVAELPRTPAGKVDRGALRARAEAAR